MNNDTGYAWVYRWFAKPDVTGSIPARVSIYLRILEVPRLKNFPHQFKFWCGRMFALWVLKDTDKTHKSFRAGLLYSIETVNANKIYTGVEFRNLRQRSSRLSTALRDVEKFKQQAIIARKQLSELKRKQAP